MKKVLNGIPSFHALGLKKQLIAAAICAGLGMSINLTHAASPNANPPSVKAGAPHVYVVKKGDTLWDISGKFLSKPWRWPEIWASNKHVKNPHWIYPGDRLLLCSLNGKPLIGKDEGDGCDGIIRRYSGNTSTLRPKVRIEALNNSVPVIPLADIQQWLERTSVLPASAIAIHLMSWVQRIIVYLQAKVRAFMYVVKVSKMVNVMAYTVKVNHISCLMKKGRNKI
jgi:hypothetical protein